jgi:hypothetical protein
MLNFGTITLTGTGGVKETFHNISHPLEFGEAFRVCPRSNGNGRSPFRVLCSGFVFKFGSGFGVLVPGWRS